MYPPPLGCRNLVRQAQSCSPAVAHHGDFVKKYTCDFGPRFTSVWSHSSVNCSRIVPKRSSRLIAAANLLSLSEREIEEVENDGEDPRGNKFRLDALNISGPSLILTLRPRPPLNKQPHKCISRVPYLTNSKAIYILVHENYRLLSYINIVLQVLFRTKI